VSRQGLARLAALFIGLAALLLCGAARAGTPLAQLNSWAGTVNYTGTVATMRTSDNDSGPCKMYAATRELSATLSGIPAGATILSARLYWAGSGSTADSRVNFQGAEVAATRTYTTGTDIAGYNYFSGAVDVTAQVLDKARDGKYGNGTYTFSGLEVDTGSTYCSREGVLGGFSLLVVYSHSDEPFRVMNLYEGFQYVHNSKVSLTLSNFRMPDKLDKTSALLGHITWEGDDSLYGSNEFLLFNGFEMSDKVNKSGNQFNSASTVNGDTSSHGIDFDVYDINNKGNSKPLVAGSTSVTTTYQTGDDLVLLSAEIVAVPNVPTADLRLVMSRAADLQVGLNASYTLTVSNAGPNKEDGPVTVTDTLPSGMNTPVGSGTGWSCSTATRTVTCTWAGALAANASLPPLTITSVLTAPGTFTNSATVSGTEFDNIPANNTASDTATAISHGGGVYVFTNAACQPGVALGGAGPCDKFTGPVVAGGDAGIFVTAVDARGVPIALSTTAGTTRSLNFALSCNDPVADAGVRASYGGASLALCTANGAAPASGSAAWSALSLTFPSNTPSVPLTFNYGDAGRVTLNLRDAADMRASTTFTVRPDRMAIDVRRSRDNLPNPGASDALGLGFAMAGEEFQVSVQACAYSTKSACIGLPNFGKEKTPQTVAVTGTSQFPDKLQIAEFLDAPVNGKYTAGKFVYEEVGVIQLRPTLVGGAYFDAPESAIIRPNLWVGRFYPAYFATEIANALTCLSKMQCPADLTATGENMMRGAVYSGQPFPVAVKPMSYLGKELAGYVGAYGKTVTLEAFSKPAALTAPAAGKFNCGQGALTINPVTEGFPTALPAHCFATAFSNTAPRALNWSPPTPVYVRASAPEEVITLDPASPTGTSHASISVTSREVGFEAGVTVLTGRLLVANAFGSELLKLPVGLTAQYWTGSGWENNTGDNGTTVGGTAAFTQCVKGLSLAARAGAANCQPALALVPAQQVKLVNGAGKLWLRAPGAGFTGSGYLDLTNLGSPPWLPSTLGRVTFGIYKSPLIYIREVY
jgi:uncharacterized repeat protein (TIGR01451 family)